jgi:hypothetical protein
MACPQIAAEENGLQTWRITVPLKGGPSGQCLHMGLMILHRTDSACYKMINRTLGLDGFFVTTYKYFCIEVKHCLFCLEMVRKKVVFCPCTIKEAPSASNMVTNSSFSSSFLIM